LIALIINAHQFERDGIDVEFCFVYIERPPLQMDADVKTRFSSRLTRQQAV
jgi:hypothetical protein